MVVRRPIQGFLSKPLVRKAGLCEFADDIVQHQPIAKIWAMQNRLKAQAEIMEARCLGRFMACLYATRWAAPILVPLINDFH